MIQFSAERGRVEEGRAQALGEHQRDAQRQGQEDDERDVEGGDDVRRNAGPQQAVEESRRVVPQEHRPVDVGELDVEELVGAEERDRGLEVPVGEVARVERDDRDRHDAGPPGRPALAAYRGHGRARGPAGAGEAAGAEEDVEADEERHPGAHLHHVERRDVVGVAEGHAGSAGSDQRGDRRDDGDEGSSGNQAPAHNVGLAIGVPPRDAPSRRQLQG